MNRYYKFTALLLVLALISCYRDEPLTEPGQEGPSQLKRSLRNGDDVKMIVDPENPNKITPQRAEFIAVKAASDFSENANTRTFAVKSVSKVEPILSSGVILSSAGTRSAADTADTLMYAVNFAADEGFALVSFDDRDGDILMYSENGNFDMEEIMASDGIMKFHVDMVMAYQQDKLNRIREAEAAGIEYVGEIRMDTVSVEEFDFPTEPTDNPYEEVIVRAGAPGIPGSGLPGSGGGGMPGMPGAYTRIPSEFQIIGWQGNYDVINMVERKYGPNPRTFGLPVAAPRIDFNPLGVPGENAPPCPYPPYCNPEIVDYNGYYSYYGAKLTTRYENPKYISIQKGPLLTTFWDQDYPINKYCYVTRWFPGILPDTKDRVPAGCVSVAMLQIMAYHKYPTYFDYNHVWDANSIPHSPRIYLDMDRLSTYRTNTDLENSPDGGEALACLSREIGNRVGMWYTSQGSGPPSMFWGAKKLRKVFKSFSYNVHNPKKNFKNPDKFPIIKDEIYAKRPVFIYGFPSSTYSYNDPDDDDDDVSELDYDTKFEEDLVLTKGDGIDPFNGHAWVIDGYKEVRKLTVYRDYRFDEYGNYNDMEQRSNLSYEFVEYLHSNMGWGDDKDYLNIWVLKGVYMFAGHNYAAKLFFLYDIYPNPK